MATLIQIRRDTEANWISNNPILASGEIAFSTDQYKIKIGDGVSNWSSLGYMTATPTEIAAQIDAAVSGLVDSAPGVLDTLNELAAAINDDPNFFSTVATNLSNHEADTTNIHGIADTSLLATTSYVDTAESDAVTSANAYSDSLAINYDPAGSASAAQTAAQSYADSLAVNYDPAGSAATAESNANSYADSLAVNYDPAGSASTAESNANSYTDSVVSTHNTDTTSVHGIPDTANLVYTNDSRLSDSRTPTAHASTHTSGGSDEITVAQSQVTNLTTDLASKISSAEKGSANGVATLDGNTKIPSTQLPAIAITSTFVVVSEAAMLALTAQEGDVAVRSDLNKSFILAGSDPTILANWQELLTPTDAVQSVDGRTGTVSLSDLYDAAGSASTAESNANSYSDSLASNYDPAGSASAAQTAAEAYADSLAVNYDPAGSAATAESNANSYTDSAVSTHNLDTTSVHGISNTADLVYTNDSRLSDARTPTAHASSHQSGGADELTLAQSQITNLSTDLADKAPLASPSFTGSITLDSKANIDTSTTTVSTTSATTIDTLDGSSYRSAEYLVQVTQGSKQTVSKVVMIHDGTTANISEYAVIELGGTRIPLTISSTVSGSNVLLQATITDADTTNATVEVVRTAIVL